MTPTTLEFFVPGLPAPGGSKKGFPIKRANGTIGVTLTDDAKRNAPWRASVSLEARIAMGGHEPFDGPLELDVTFVMPRPRGHFGSGRNAERIKPSAPSHHVVKPDRTKLLRALEDAMTMIVWRDDTQVVSGTVSKVYGMRPGARVTVRLLNINPTKEAMCSSKAI